MFFLGVGFFKSDNKRVPSSTTNNKNHSFEFDVIGRLSSSYNPYNSKGEHVYYKLINNPDLKPWATDDPMRGSGVYGFIHGLTNFYFNKEKTTFIKYETETMHGNVPISNWLEPRIQRKSLDEWYKIIMPIIS